MANPAQLTFEHLALALEATRNTAVTPPTDDLRLKGMIDPKQTWHQPNQHLGLLTDRTAAPILIREWGEWSGDGECDVSMLPTLLNMALKGGVTTPVHPVIATHTGILSWLWTFNRSLTSDDLKSATMYWGDANVAIWQGVDGMMDDLTITSDAGAVNSVGLKCKGITRYPTVLGSPPTWPAIANGQLLVPGLMQLWIDEPGGTYGTTEVAARVLHVEHGIPTGVKPRYMAQGPTSDRSYKDTGRVQVHPTTKITLELYDTVEYAKAQDGLQRLVRVRQHGALIETISGTPFYNYLNLDFMGTLMFTGFKEYESMDRTLELTVDHDYDPSLGTDCRATVQTLRATL